MAYHLLCIYCSLVPVDNRLSLTYSQFLGLTCFYWVNGVTAITQKLFLFSLTPRIFRWSIVLYRPLRESGARRSNFHSWWWRLPTMPVFAWHGGCVYAGTLFDASMHLLGTCSRWVLPVSLHRDVAWIALRPTQRSQSDHHTHWQSVCCHHVIAGKSLSWLQRVCVRRHL